MKKKKIVFITGGSGFLGINVIRYFLKRGFAIRSYDLAPFTYPEMDRITSIVGDVRDAKSVRKAIKGADFVIHCAAALPLYTPHDIYTTEVDGARVVLEAARMYKASRVVIISSTAVYGVPDHHPTYETDRLVGVGPYGEAKIQAEAISLSYRKKGMCVTIVRPKTFVGPERLGVFALLYDWASTGHHFPILGNGKNRYQLLDVEDLCAFLYLCLTKPRSVVNDTFNVGASVFSTMKNDFQSVLSKAGYGKHIICLPDKPIIFVLKLLETLKLSPLYQWIYETAGKESFVSIDKAKSIGFSPKYSNKQALLRNFSWYMAKKDSFTHETGVSHRVPWKQGALQLAKLFF